MPILHLAGMAPYRCRPVNSALGGEGNMPWLARSEGAAFHMADAASRGLRPQVPSFAIIRAQFRPRQVRQEQAALQTALRRQRLRGPLRLYGQAVGRHLNGRHSSWQKKYSGSVPRCPVRAWQGQSGQHQARWQRRPPHCGACRIGVALAHGLQQPWASSGHTSPPNPSLNRSANGMAPCPRGAVCLSCTSRAWRHTAVARLTLR